METTTTTSAPDPPSEPTPSTTPTTTTAPTATTPERDDHHDGSPAGCARSGHGNHPRARPGRSEREGVPQPDREHPGHDPLRRVAWQLLGTTEPGERLRGVPVHRVHLEPLRRLRARLPGTAEDPGRAGGHRRQPVPRPVEQRRLDDPGDVVLPPSRSGAGAHGHRAGAVGRQHPDRPRVPTALARRVGVPVRSADSPTAHARGCTGPARAASPVARISRRRSERRRRSSARPRSRSPCSVRPGSPPPTAAMPATSPRTPGREPRRHPRRSRPPGCAPRRRPASSSASSSSR